MIYVRIKEDDIVIKIICILLFLLIFPIKTNAVYDVIDARCTTTLKTSLKEEVQNFTYRLSKSQNANEVFYTIYLYNVSENIDLIDENGNKYNRTQINNLKQGSTLKINVIASNNTYCAGYKMATKTVKIPYYNKYYGTDFCKGYENISLCSENEKVLYDEGAFVKQLQNYKESLEEREDKESTSSEEKNDNMYGILYNNRYYIIGIAIPVIASIVVYIIIKQKNKGIL